MLNTNGYTPLFNSESVCIGLIPRVLFLREIRKITLPIIQNSVNSRITQIQLLIFAVTISREKLRYCGTIHYEATT
jgi:hypothetical protein